AGVGRDAAGGGTTGGDASGAAGGAGVGTTEVGSGVGREDSSTPSVDGSLARGGGADEIVSSTAGGGAAESVGCCGGCDGAPGRAVTRVPGGGSDALAAAGIERGRAVRIGLTIRGTDSGYARVSCSSPSSMSSRSRSTAGAEPGE